MNFLTDGINEILNLTNNIANRQYKKDKWLLILDALSRIFNAEGAFIGIWTKESIELKYSSSIIKSYKASKSRKIKKINLKDRKIFKDSFIKDGYIKIEDYENYEYALEEWKNMGLKSLLAVTIATSKKIYGSLHIVNLYKKAHYNNKHIQALKMIANMIALELEKEQISKKLKVERDANAQYVKLLNSIAVDRKTSGELDNYISDTLLKIKLLTNADAISFVMPSEAIYARLNSSFSNTTYEEFAKSPLYDLWKDNIENTVELTKAIISRYKINHVKKALVLPIISNLKTVALLCIGFKDTLSVLEKRKLALAETMLKYFVSLLYTYKNISKISMQLSATETGLIKAFVSAMEAKDVYTKGHSEHVGIYAKNIGKILNLDEEQQESLYNAGLLHDIGKIGIPDNILLKPGRLMPHEYEIMKLHPIFSYEIVKNIPKFKPIANCIKHHHEKLDGSGYPDGLKKDEIELGARILTIADIFDALTTQRPYRNSLAPNEAIKILKKESIDYDILAKAEKVLKKTYENEITKKDTFVPSTLSKTRKDMIKRDYTTGLYRRVALVEIMNNYIKNNEQFTLFMVDIKNISYINYKYGVDVGDKIIVFVAEELNTMQNIDALARTDADVFMFIYNGNDPESFKEYISEKLKAGMILRVKQKSCVLNEKDANKIIGCYITYSEYPKDSQKAEELIYSCLMKKKDMLCKK